MKYKMLCIFHDIFVFEINFTSDKGFIVMKELNIFDMKKISGGYIYRMRPVSSNVEDRRGLGRGLFWGIGAGW